MIRNRVLGYVPHTVPFGGWDSVAASAGRDLRPAPLPHDSDSATTLTRRHNDQGRSCSSRQSRRSADATDQSVPIREERQARSTGREQDGLTLVPG